MTPDPNLLSEIPQKVKDAAMLLEKFFKEKGVDKWELYGVYSRKSVDAAYNSGLDTAISLAEECEGSTVLICGLESSKK